MDNVKITRQKKLCARWSYKSSYASTLPFWKDRSRTRFFLNLPFRDYPGLNVRSFQVDYNCCKPDVEILAANDKMTKCVRGSSQPSYHKEYFFVTSEEVPETNLRINTVCNFLPVKSAVELNRLLLKFLLCHADIQESCREDIQHSTF